MIKRNIPNTITLGNLLCGCLAIVKAFEGDLIWASYLVGIAAVLDFFDGFVARLLKVTSPIGKDLDSLADMVTFGVVPGIIIFHLIASSNDTIYLSDIYVGARHTGRTGLEYIAFVIPIFSCIRLAKFNNDTRQSESFIGLPTPANAILICSLPLFVDYHVWPLSVQTRAYLPSTYNFEDNFYILHNPWFLALGSCVLAFLLIAPIPLFALKFKHFKWKGNEIRYSFLIWCVLLFAFLQLLGIPLIIISYILFSLVNNIFKKQRHKPL